MHLPETIVRENNKLYEEVCIPHTEGAPTNVGDQRVRIADLDEVRAELREKQTRMNRNFACSAFWTLLIPYLLKLSLLKRNSKCKIGSMISLVLFGWK